MTASLPRAWGPTKAACAHYALIASGGKSFPTPWASAPSWHRERGHSLPTRDVSRAGAGPAAVAHAARCYVSARRASCRASCALRVALRRVAGRLGRGALNQTAVQLLQPGDAVVPGEELLHAPPPGGAHARAQMRIREQFANGGGEPFAIAPLDEDAGLPIDYHFGQGTAARGHHRQPRGHRLDHRDAERLVPERGEDEDPGPGVVGADLVIGHTAVEKRAATERAHLAAQELVVVVRAAVVPSQAIEDRVAAMRVDILPRREIQRTDETDARARMRPQNLAHRGEEQMHPFFRAEPP